MENIIFERNQWQGDNPCKWVEMPALDLRAKSPCKDAHKGHQPSNSRNWRLRHKIWKKHSKTKPEYSAPSRSLRLSVLYHLITMFPLFWCSFFSWVLRRSPRPSRAKVRLLSKESMLRCFKTCQLQMRVMNWYFPDLNFASIRWTACLHTSFFSGVFVASIAYRLRD